MNESPAEVARADFPFHNRFEPDFAVDFALGGVRDLTPYLTPYGADAGAISGRGWIRNSRISQEKRRSGRIRTRLDGPECDS